MIFLYRDGDDDEIKRLYMQHQKLCEEYFQCPESYPGHDVSKGKYMDKRAKDMVIQNNFISGNDLDNEWKQYWHSFVKEDLETEWLKKKLSCLQQTNTKIQSPQLVEKTNLEKASNIPDTLLSNNFRECDTNQSVLQFLNQINANPYFIPKYFPFIKEYITLAKFYNDNGANENYLLTNDFVDLLDNIKKELGYNLHYSQLSQIEYTGVSSLIKTLEDFINYSHHYIKLAESKDTVLPTILFCSLPKEINSTFIENLVAKLEVYNSLDYEEKTVLDKLINEIYEKDEPLAISLLINKH